MARILVVVAFLALPVAQAAMQIEGSEGGLIAPSGKYQDGHTLAVYDYDEVTDALLPVGVAANRDGFYTIDIVSPGQKPATGHGFCNDQKYCIGARALAANPEEFERWLSIGVETICGESRIYRQPFVAPAHHYERYPGSLACQTPNVTARLYLDDVEMVSDQWP